MSGIIIDTIKTNALTVTQEGDRIEIKYRGKRGGRKRINVDAIRIGGITLKDSIVAQEIIGSKLVTYYNLYSEPELFVIEQKTEGKPDTMVLGDSIAKSIIMGE